jgi:diguanylate cyclase (GGDEF)-like protein/PAS domain S-box-containing protein
VATDEGVSAVAGLRPDGRVDLGRPESVDESMFRTVVDSSPVGLVVLEVDGSVRYVNRSMLQMVRCSAAQFGQFARVQLELERDRWSREYDQIMLGEVEVITVEDSIARPDGTSFWAVIEITRMRGDPHASDQLLIRVTDATARHRLEAELRAAEAQYRVLVEKVPAIVYIAEPGPEGRWLYVSPQIERILGYTAEQWLADPGLWLSRVHPDDRARVLDEDVEHAAEGPSASTIPSTYRLLRSDGTIVWVRDAAAVELDHSGRPLYHGVLTDVTAEKALEERLAYLAEHDQLTGLYNAPAVARRLSTVLNRLGDGGSVGVVFVDLDKFKQVNDEYGHAVGDALLRQIGHSLTAAIRSLSGTAAGRIGGDEFVVVAGGLDGTGTERLAARVLVAVQRASVPVGGQLIGVGASVGFSVGVAGDSPDALLSRADRAMYRAKVRGGGRIGLTHTP